MGHGFYFLPYGSNPAMTASSEPSWSLPNGRHFERGLQISNEQASAFREIHNLKEANIRRGFSPSSRAVRDSTAYWHRQIVAEQQMPCSWHKVVSEQQNA